MQAWAVLVIGLFSLVVGVLLCWFGFALLSRIIPTDNPIDAPRFLRRIVEWLLASRQLT